MYIPHFVRSKSQRKKLPYKRGVGQKMTKADEGGRGGHPNADNCWRGGEGGSAKRWPLLTEGGGGVYELLFLADVICEQPLIELVSSSARVTSVKSAQGLRVSQWERTGPIDRTPGTPGSDKKHEQWFRSTLYVQGRKRPTNFVWNYTITRKWVQKCFCIYIDWRSTILPTPINQHRVLRISILSYYMYSCRLLRR